MSESTSNQPWPQAGSKLFTEGGEYYQFSHIGWGTTKTQFHGYEHGYKEAADALLERAIRSRDIKTLDTAFFPICFLYRQYVELAMKSIYLEYAEVSKQKKIEFIATTNHNLVQIWEHVRSVIAPYCNPTERSDLDVVSNYIEQFHQFDHSSFTFRYPINKKLQAVFGSEKRVNLAHLRDRMIELQNFFIGCAGKLSEVAEWREAEADAILSSLND